MTLPVWGVVLAGGIGSRFWPVSTPARPKQLLPLAGDRPLLTETVARFAPLIAPSQVLVLTGEALVPAVRAAVPEVPAENLLAEPSPRGTAAALAWAAHVVQARAGPDALLVCVHADWAIGDPPAYRATLALAARAARELHLLVTVGIVPTRADAGFGYIVPGDPTAVPPARRVARFVEKPDAERAAALIADGAMWNSGIFAWRAVDLLDAIRRHCPEVAPALAQADAGAAAFFDAVVTPIAVDQGVLERSPAVAVLPGAFGWDDVGTWPALRRVRPLDGHGNAVHGRVVSVDAAANIVYAEGTTVVLYGVRDLVVAARDGVVLVTPVDRAGDLKPLVEQLPRELRDG